MNYLDLLLVEEVVNYTLGDLLSDIGGILGFFLGLSLLQVRFQNKKKKMIRKLVLETNLAYFDTIHADSYCKPMRI